MHAVYFVRGTKLYTATVLCAPAENTLKLCAPKLRLMRSPAPELKKNVSASGTGCDSSGILHASTSLFMLPITFCSLQCLLLLPLNIPIAQIALTLSLTPSVSRPIGKLAWHQHLPTFVCARPSFPYSLLPLPRPLQRQRPFPFLDYPCRSGKRRRGAGRDGSRNKSAYTRRGCDGRGGAYSYGCGHLEGERTSGEYAGEGS